ncbi:unnamed protein product [Cylicostephanus goldi]|uniref:DSBA-like thioredoxin domain-containing protein n=1 Tax=Cylicostephanus goldi TaxID=71465 RepID=A0A3P6S343_CYLGO|nr:unnamed protein product [Cylicostephanus goldi]
MPPRIPVDFFFDVFSPYSWIGFEGLVRYKKVWPIDLRLRPFYLAGIIKSTKNPGAPMMLAQKQKYMELDLERNSRYWGIPISLPKDFKNIVFSNSSAGAQRLLIAVQRQQPARMEQLARTLWRRMFTEHTGVFDRSALLEVGRIPQNRSRCKAVEAQTLQRNAVPFVFL